MTDKIILAGNPNVGKSTLFNSLTGLSQHTGNWTGKTVGSATGRAFIGGREKIIIDTPGTYSLYGTSADEDAASKCICSEKCDAVVVVCDGCCLERGLFLAMQIAQRRDNLILCVNMMDEAAKNGIAIDFSVLEAELGIPVLGLSAAKAYPEALAELLSEERFEKESEIISDRIPPSVPQLWTRAHEICSRCVILSRGCDRRFRFDRFLCSRILALPLMLILLFAVLWLSISGANYPSALLSICFDKLGGVLTFLLSAISAPDWIIGFLIDGVYGTSAWVVSVMLPPMAIFFPLFSLLEDFGLLPRIAFNMDFLFRKCGGCGKQALTMCMGLGCNAVGVTGCRIISGRKERLIAILTNSLMPCNGRFPGLILMAGLLSASENSASASLMLLALVGLSLLLTVISSRILSALIKNTEPSLFSLELPSFRIPDLRRTIVHSFTERTLPVLLRAIKVSAPAGAIIWLLANLGYGEKSLLSCLCSILDPIGSFIGLDGAILLGFILGLPANEIVLPVIMLCYFSVGSLAALPPIEKLSAMLFGMGWTEATVVCVMLFSLCHWPCATTLLTVKKECGGMKWVILSAVLPTAWGILLCLAVKLLA